MERALWAGATNLVVAIAIAGCGGGSSGRRPTPTPTSIPVPFANPPEIASADGVLAATLTVQPAVQTVAGQDVTFLELYNGMYVPPVLRVQPGDRIELRLRNYGYLSTNVHYHGLNVTPLGTGDNVFLDIESGITFDYDFTIPSDHAQGLYWYHPHFDPLLNTQIAGGMSGGLIIGDILEPFPQLAGIPERVILLKDLKTEDGQPVLDPDPSGPTTRTINGLFQPQLTMQPGQIEFWRIGNIGSNIYYQLSLTGQLFNVIAIDGNLQNQVTTSDTLIVPPGGRVEALVYGPQPGSYQFAAAAFDTGPDGDSYPGQLLATVVSQGPPVTPIPLPTSFPPLTDLSKGPITRQRTVVFADTANPNQFTIDGKPYSPDCIDTVVTLGDVEEWTIENTAQEAHVFHIHQLDFQVTAINGEPQPFIGYQDVVTLPPATDTEASTVTVIIPFTNPVIVGKFVYHCHIIQHEDQGMMATILVQEPGAPPPDEPICQPPPR
jgi:FtsP/CotA-like multicopper oxidase with cupredoxin domain